MNDAWRTLPASEAFEITMGRQRSPKHATGDHLVPYLRAANVGNGVLDLDDVLEMNFTPDEQEKYALRLGDVLVTEGCGSLRELGASTMWRAELPRPVGFQNTLLRLRAVDGVTLPAFVEIWARHAYSTGVFSAIAKGTNIFHIGARRMAELDVLVPPLEDQRRIADLVAALDETVMRAEQLVHDSAQLIDGLFAGEAPARTRPLGEIAEIKGGKRLPKGTPWADRATDHPYIRVMDLDSGRISVDDLVYVRDDVWPTISRYVVDRDDVIISIVGTIGEVALVPPELAGANLTENAARIRVDTSAAAPSFIAAFLRSRAGQAEVERLTVGTTQKKLALFRIAMIEAPDTPRHRQDALGSLVASCDDLRASAARQVKALQGTRTSILDELLGGHRHIPESYDRVLEAAS